MDKTTSECTCGQFNAHLCDRQNAKTGKRFCNGSMKATGRDTAGVFASYAAATAAKGAGQKVRLHGAGYANGAPRRFCLVSA